LYEFDLYDVGGMHRWWGISNIQQVGPFRCKIVSKAPKDNNLHIRAAMQHALADFTFFFGNVSIVHESSNKDSEST